MFNKLCSVCNVVFSCAYSGAKFCSKKCFHKHLIKSGKYVEETKHLFLVKPENKLCVTCGLEFLANRPKTQKYCSKKCIPKYVYPKKIKILVNKLCITCGIKSTHRKYCSEKCRYISKCLAKNPQYKKRRNIMGIYCLNCNNLFYSHKRRVDAKFCSKFCNFDYIKKNGLRKGSLNSAFGKKRPDLSALNKTSEHIERVRRVGWHHTDECKDDIGVKSRASRLIEQNWVKEKNPSWKGGVTPFHSILRGIPKYDRWRRDVFVLRGAICDTCGSEKYLHAHHIIWFSELLSKNNITSIKEAEACDELWDVNNGQVLCEACHGKIHNFNWGWLRARMTNDLSV